MQSFTPHTPDLAAVYDRPLRYAPPKASFEEGSAHCLYVDAHLAVVIKPEGLLSVPGKAAGHADCLATRAAGDIEGARIVHRLDLATSGLMVLARTPEAHRHLGLQFERRHVKKRYVADVWGHLQNDQGTVDAPMRCDWPRRPRQIIDHAEGRSAVTSWEVIARGANHSRVALTPLTGRSHQLRVHMLWLGHPILGDTLYAPDEAYFAAPRLCLHASRLEFFHPVGGKACVFDCPAPFTGESIL